MRRRIDLIEIGHFWTRSVFKSFLEIKFKIWPISRCSLKTTLRGNYTESIFVVYSSFNFNKKEKKREYLLFFHNLAVHRERKKKRGWDVPIFELCA